MYFFFIVAILVKNTLLLITCGSRLHYAKWKRTLFKIVSLGREIFWVLWFWGRRHPPRVYTNITTQLLQRVYTPCTPLISEKPVTTWEAIPRPQQRRLQCGLRLKAESVYSSGELWGGLLWKFFLACFPTSNRGVPPCNTIPASLHKDEGPTGLANREKVDTYNVLMSI